MSCEGNGIRLAHSLSPLVMFDTPAVVYPLVLSALVLVVARRRKKSALPYPPGPKGYPILGNVLDLPSSVPACENFQSLANKYGTPQRRFVSREFSGCPPTGTDILYLRVMGDDIVVLSSSEAISDLLEKRSGIYSERVSCTTILVIRS